MLVADLRARISHQEYVEWWIYFRRQAQRAELESKRAQGRKG